MTKTLKIGFIYFHGLGDNILTFESLYALKMIYHCELFVFGNALFKNLLAHCDFVDEVYDIQNDIRSHLDLINSCNLDYIILPKCTKIYLTPLLQSNVLKILTPTKIPALLSKKCKTPSIFSFLRYRNASMREKPLFLVRLINPKLFDSHISKIVLSQAKICTSITHQNKISNFLQKSVKEGDHLILINPFAITSSHNLSIEAYLKLAHYVSTLPSCIPLIVTYSKVTQEFDEALKHFQQHTKLHSLIIFENDEDILNLAELIFHTTCVISPSTGIIHLASNLSIPTIGLYPKTHIPQWETKDKRYVFIKSPKDQITPKEEEEILDQTMALLKSILPSIPYL
ncbi:glycosyltransferase family 9 protein [Helicobacter kayseriensis]|uniref:glycosyltransferase family 9 protein n=1 Tax=Helicobacter kayseriensis TaxID=2905877 RepID=UPI001E5063E8|nr:glycosyltransferase family 9 protein [Helicobacter kayseriensis]MCE3046758.1 lipopolysaccharide heptosyltransferase family protein [Helicobacter kayseriensis]MCE3047940.1 lipopolysaccharide heptosyltransferase family protein [Helicobacter kayseriensis]